MVYPGVEKVVLELSPGGTICPDLTVTDTSCTTVITSDCNNESTEVQNPRRNSYTQTMDVCITPCTVVDSPSLQLYL